MACASLQAQTFYWNPSPVTGAGEIHKSYNWTSNADGSGARPASALDDGFSASTLASAWTYADSVKDTANSASMSLTAKPGKLVLTARGKDVWNNDNKFVAVYRKDIPSNFDVTVEVDSEFKTDPWTKAGILIFNDFTNIVSGGAFLVAVTPGNGFIVHYDSAWASGHFDAPHGGVDTAAYPCWLRAVRSGNQFTGYYKKTLNGAWKPIYKTVTTLNTGASSQVALFTTSHNATTTTTAVFDNFTGGGDFTSTSLDLNFNGTSSANNVAANLTGDVTVHSIDLKGFSGAFSFLTATLSVTGDAQFVGNPGMNIVPGTGTLAFIADTGAQNLTPRPGDTLPAVSKSGADTLRIKTNDLAAQALSVSKGILDFNGRDVALLGNLNVTGGGPATFANLRGRTLTVGGTAVLAGQAGSLLDLNPDSTWTLQVVGALSADYATVANSKATGSAGNPTATCVNGGGNVNWNFAVPVTDPPGIARQPADIAVKPGQSAVFSLGATGAKPLSYRWRRQGDTASLSVDTSLTIAAPSLSDDASLYYCIVTNAYGADTSRAAKLTVSATCDSVFRVSADTVVDEGAQAVVNGTAQCASSYQWTVVSGPPLAVADFMVPTLYFTAPRVTHDTVIVLKFSADYAGQSVEKLVHVTVKEAIPDPKFSMPSPQMWDGKLQLAIRPVIANLADLKKFPDKPLNFIWSLSARIVDTVQAGDSLVLSNPSQNGNLDVTLCLDNGGAPWCDTTLVQLSAASVSIRFLRAGHGAVGLVGDALWWRARARVRIYAWDGKLLWRGEGVPGTVAELPEAAVRGLNGHRVRLQILPY